MDIGDFFWSRLVDEGLGYPVTMIWDREGDTARAVIGFLVGQDRRGAISVGVVREGESEVLGGVPARLVRYLSDDTRVFDSFDAVITCVRLILLADPGAATARIYHSA